MLGSSGALSPSARLTPARGPTGGAGAAPPAETSASPGWGAFRRSPGRGRIPPPTHACPQPPPCLRRFVPSIDEPDPSPPRRRRTPTGDLMNHFQRYLAEEFAEDFEEGRLPRREGGKMIASCTGSPVVAQT